jgi:hypothetical protein
MGIHLNNCIFKNSDYALQKTQLIIIAMIGELKLLK